MVLTSLLPALSGFGPMVLCFGEDGHVALEAASRSMGDSHDCCDVSQASMRLDNAAFMGVVDKSCGPCRDVMIFSGFNVTARSGRSDTTAKLIATFDLPLACFATKTLCTADFLGNFTRRTSSDVCPPPSWSSARTTILLI
ncbi:MAG: hypothetical protein NTW19_03690 [Planctomycetota bacterium]|nr:hypothetical protein [Planctomycetota bacterium]